jgi:hypothetical protein
VEHLNVTHMDSWNRYGDESCDFRMQMCLLVTIDVLGGATGIRPSTEQGHPTEGTSRWLPPFSSVTWVSKVNLLWMIYCCAI